MPQWLVRLRVSEVIPDDRADRLAAEIGQVLTDANQGTTEVSGFVHADTANAAVNHVRECVRTIAKLDRETVALAQFSAEESSG